MPANRQRQSRVLQWLTLVPVIVGVPSMLSYALGAAFVLRMAKPALGAWWDAHQFYFMEGAATALGLLVAVRIGRGLIDDPEMRTRCTVWAAILAVPAAAPLMHVCAAAARLDLGVFGAGMQSWVVGVAGYDKAKQLDKLLIAGIYFLKTACLAVIAGLALVALVAAVSSTTGGGNEPKGAPSDSPAQP